MGKRKVSIVIPVYNEEKILETAVNRLKKDLDQFRDEFDFEIILAENGSTDRTIEKGGELSILDSSPPFSIVRKMEVLTGQ
ncbi:MAG TPA: glycosyltransferase [bacterium]|nr:glycosyltransferase [bacterium]